MNSSEVSQENKLLLEKCKHNVYSQCGEDGIIQYFLNMMNVTTGFFVEFGAWDGKHLSNCASLAEKGWGGCFIEADSERFKDLKKNYASNSNVHLLQRLVASSGSDSLDNILKEINAPKEFTILSIDIDGNDYHIWNSLSAFSPLICIIEFNPTIPSNVSYIQNNELNLNFGSSLTAFYELAQSKGYCLVAATEWNAFFVPVTICEQFNIPAYRPEEVKSQEYEMSIFQGYNGQIVITGLNKLLWHGINLTDEDLQVLPEKLRKIPINQPVEFFHALENFKSSRES